MSGGDVMAMRRRKPKQDELSIATGKLLQSPRNPFCERLTELLGEQGFDQFVEGRCARCYADWIGHPSVPPGVDLRELLPEFIEDLASECGISWRYMDTLALHQFLGKGPGEGTPDHSTLSMIRMRTDAETHQKASTWVLEMLTRRDPAKRRAAGVDATTLEAKTAARCVARWDTSQGYQDHLTAFAKASRIAEPTRPTRTTTRAAFYSVQGSLAHV